MLANMDRVRMDPTATSGSGVVLFVSERLKAPNRQTCSWYTSDLIARLDWIRWTRLGYHGKVDWPAAGIGFYTHHP
ncbi:hypothetical protein P879_03874 [Paragonimus westermani]|uniref:Uncharacterized protein n=1 Tax=Paragonimus westermani TaxID=34504 RepID=A0A8T0DI21_9TREM|nr:hypothetical protein P879_03874 [Paragonimus westermani]